MLEKLKLNGSMKTQRPSRINTPKRCPLHYRRLESKLGSQETPGVTGKFGLGVQNEAGQKLTVLPTEHTGHSKQPLPTTREDSTHGHHQMVNNEIRLIIFFAAKDGEALYISKNKTGS